MDAPAIIYLRKRWVEQPFWSYAAGDAVRRTLPTPLDALLSQERVVVGPEAARRILDYFYAQGFSDDEPPNLRTPVEIVDYDGNRVLLAALAPSA